MPRSTIQHTYANATVPSITSYAGITRIRFMGRNIPISSQPALASSPDLYSIYVAYCNTIMVKKQLYAKF